MATATRGTGLALVPAFFLVAWRERRPPIAYVAAIAAGAGMLLFAVYCAIHFGDALAFIHVQQAWKQPSWLDVFGYVLKLRVGSMLKILLFFGGAYLFWHFRTKLPRIAVAYGFCSLALLVYSGNLNSVNRYVYGIVSLSLALGLLFKSHPRWGYLVLGLCAVLLVGFAVKFAWWGWVA